MPKEKQKINIIGSILKEAIEIRNKKIPIINFFHVQDPKKSQNRELKKLLVKASETHFGEAYKFKRILQQQDFRKAFKESVPVFDYDKMFVQWWDRCLHGETFISWPGKIKYFALSSGTSGATSKYIPVTNEMVKAIRKTSTRQLFSLAKYDFPNELYEKGALMLGGSTHLQYNGTYYAGDLSGITTGNLPFWFEYFYKPGRRISKERDWPTKLEEIIKKAPEWDIAAIVGVPAWLQILLQKIIERYNLNNIHDIWPNLEIYVHGGVSFEPYRKSFEKLLAHPLAYMETYLASEGFLAFQNRPNTSAMELVLDNGIFFEFIPFNEQNFDESGNMVDKPKTLFIDEVEQGKVYALLISTCSGAWRYLIGDTIKFTSIERHEIIITGRTKSYLSICGEHLSVDIMNHAVRMLGEEKGVGILEYTVLGVECDGMFAHRWFLGCDEPLDEKDASSCIDEYLKTLNDDYRVERLEAIRKISVEVLPTEVFYAYMRKMGKEGAQNKFLRVLKGSKAEEWLSFVKEYKKQ
ncbi:MAG: GH3 auxin-responsive promoter family protein [Bacteroidales bacterium]